jgi:hypothetical protein
MAARARLALELSLPASIRSSQQRGGWNRGGSDIRMGSPAHGPAGVFLYIARHKPALCENGLLGWPGQATCLRAMVIGRSGPASLTKGVFGL